MIKSLNKYQVDIYQVIYEANINDMDILIKYILIENNSRINNI